MHTQCTKLIRAYSLYSGSTISIVGLPFSKVALQIPNSLKDRYYPRLEDRDLHNYLFNFADSMEGGREEFMVTEPPRFWRT